MHRRSLKQLINKKESAWPLVVGWLQEAKNQVELLPASEPARSDALEATQVTTKSPMGAVVYESGGILVDHGWLRILGSGHPRLARSLPDWNSTVGNEIADGMPFLFIADDVIGGFYALDGGALGAPGNVFYFTPDSFEWESTDMGYSEFLQWCLVADFEKYYANFRWSGWQDEIQSLTGVQGISIYPFLCAEGPPIAERHRGIVPILELYEVNVGKPSFEFGASAKRNCFADVSLVKWLLTSIKRFMRR